LIFVFNTLEELTKSYKKLSLIHKIITNAYTKIDKELTLLTLNPGGKSLLTLNVAPEIVKLIQQNTGAINKIFEIVINSVVQMLA